MESSYDDSQTTCMYIWLGLYELLFRQIAELYIIAYDSNVTMIMVANVILCFVHLFYRIYTFFTESFPSVCVTLLVCPVIFGHTSDVCHVVIPTSTMTDYTIILGQNNNCCEHCLLPSS